MTQQNSTPEPDVWPVLAALHKAQTTAATGGVLSVSEAQDVVTKTLEYISDNLTDYDWQEMTDWLDYLMTRKIPKRRQAGHNG